MQEKLPHYLNFYTTLLNLTAYPLFALTGWIFLTETTGKIYYLAIITAIFLLAFTIFTLYRIVKISK